MTLLESIFLGAVQGLTEFLPISSSGHLIIFHRFLGTPSSFTFDVLLNIGTLLSLLIFLRIKIVHLLKDIFINKKINYLMYLLIASLPAFLVGFFANDLLKDLQADIWLIVLMLVILGLAMIRWGNIKGSRDLKASDSFAIGLAQAVALIPGTSRSGITVLVALIKGVKIKEALEFSFLLAVPTITGALVYTLIFDGGATYINENAGLILAGNLSSFLFGALAIKSLLSVVQKHGLAPFGWYRIVLGSILAVLLFTNTI